MTAPGQPLPSQDFCGTAALPLKPDIARRGWHGRKVPIGDIRAAVGWVPASEFVELEPPVHSPLMFAALMIGHHFSISAF
jgi:hypothetical protein